MSSKPLGQYSLVLYKQKAARIVKTGDKRITIELENGEQIRVRPKDVLFLHTGPVKDLADIRSSVEDSGELVTAWELLAGDTTSLQELTELAFGDNSLAATWTTWLAVADGLYFNGDPDKIIVSTAEQAEQEIALREARQQKLQAWDAFKQRVIEGSVVEKDSQYLQDVVELALGQREGSQILRVLGKEQTPENAHHLLLATGFWDSHVNPYPSRAGVDLSPATGTLPPLPEEIRRDLTHLLALAIDDEENEDPDDALSWEDGRLWVHIADVGALVAPGGAVDIEARNRGANLYLPEGTVTMLPREATRRLGLGLDDQSPALSFALDVTSDGRIRDIDIVPSWVRVTRWTYEEAEERLDEPVPSKLLEIAQYYESRRRQAGAVEINLPEVRVTVRDGIISIKPFEPLQSRMLVREAMLMTGETVACFAQAHNIAIPFTVQPPPDAALPKVDNLSAMFARRKMMRPSQPSAAVGRHSGLGMEQYAQVTSPLRRYLDLVIHQQLRAFLHGQTLMTQQEILERIGSTTSIQRDLRRAERLSRRHWTHSYLLAHPKWQGEGVVVEHHGRRHVVILPDLDLETDIYLLNTYPLDSRLRLEIQDVNLAYLETRFNHLTS